MSIFSDKRLTEMRWEPNGVRNECMEVNDEGWAENGGDNDRWRWIKGASHSRFPRWGNVGEKRDDSDRGRGSNHFYQRDRDRDRGFGGDRERDTGGAWERGERAPADRDRGYGGDRDRDRGYSGDRDRDRGFGGNRVRDTGGTWERGFGGDRGGDRGYGGDRGGDRGYGGDRGGGYGGDRGYDRDRGYGQDRDRGGDRRGYGFSRDRDDGGRYGDDRSGGRDDRGGGYKGSNHFYQRDRHVGEVGVGDDPDRRIRRAGGRDERDFGRRDGERGHYGFPSIPRWLEFSGDSQGISWETFETVFASFIWTYNVKGDDEWYCLVNSLVGPAADYFHYLVKINQITGDQGDFEDFEDCFTMKDVDWLMELLRDTFGNENRVSTTMNKILNRSRRWGNSSRREIGGADSIGVHGWVGGRGR